MADANANINVNIDTSSALAQLKSLQRQIAIFHTSIARSSETAAASQKSLQKNLLNSINSIGGFSAELRSVKTTAESFTSSLEGNKFSMREYFRFAGGATQNFGRLFKSEFDTIGKVAEERVKTLQTQYIKMGRDASGAMQAIAIRPTALDMESYGTKTAIAAQKQALFNQLMKQGSTNLLNFGKNTQWAGRQLMVGFTLPLVTLGAAASKTFIDMEAQTIKFKKVYGDLFTPEKETQQALDNIMELGKAFTQYGIVLSDTVQVASEAAAAGFSGVDLQRQTEQSIRLSILGQVDYQKALETTISVQNAFSISSDELASSIDFLNAVENQTVVSLDDITTAIPKVAPVIQQLGGDVRDLAFFMTAMKEGGINASEGANALKSGLASMINPTGRAVEMLDSFGINIKKIVVDNKGDLKSTVIEFAQALNQLDPLNRAQAIEQMFGKFQFARLSTLFANVTQEGNQASRVLDLANSTVEELAALSEKELGLSAASSMNKFKAAVEDLRITLIPIGKAFLEAATPILEFISGILEKFANLSDGTKKAITVMTVAIGVIGPVALMAFGLLANGVANIIKLFLTLRNGYLRLTGQSQILGEQTSYLTTEQMEAAAASHSLNQAHATLTQQFTAETTAVGQLIAAYQQATAAGAKFAAINPGMMRPVTGMAPRKLAGGGILSGPGTGTSDSIPAMLSNGEAVIPAKIVKKYPEMVDGLIAGNIRGFKKGGRVLTEADSTFVSSVAASAPESRQTGVTNFLTKELERMPETIVQEFKTLVTTMAQEIRLSGTALENNLKEFRSRYISTMNQQDETQFSHIGAGRKITAGNLNESGALRDEKTQERLDYFIEKVGTDVPVDLKTGFGADFTGFLNNSMQEAGASLEDVIQDSVVGGTEKWRTAIKVGGGQFEAVGEDLERFDARFNENLQSAYDRGGRIILDSQSQIEELRVKAIAKGETFDDQVYVALDTITTETLQNAETFRQGLDNVFEEALKTVTEIRYNGLTPEQAAELGPEFSGRGTNATYGRITPGATTSRRRRGGVADFRNIQESAFLDTATQDARAYNSQIEGNTQDIYLASRDRNSPHHQVSKDAKDDAIAYNLEKEKQLKASRGARSTGIITPGAQYNIEKTQGGIVTGQVTKNVKDLGNAMQDSTSSVIKSAAAANRSRMSLASLDRNIMGASFAISSLSGLTSMFGGRFSGLAGTVSKVTAAMFALQAITGLLTQTKTLELITTQRGRAVTAMKMAKGGGGISPMAGTVGKAGLRGGAARAALGIAAFFGPVGAAVAAVAAIGLIALSIKNLIDKQKEQKLIAESAFKASSEVATFFGNSAANALIPLGNLSLVLDKTAQDGNKLVGSLGLTYQEISSFKTMIEGLPSDNPLATLIKGITNESDPKKVEELAVNFVKLQVALGQIKVEDAEKLMQLILSSAGKSGLIGQITADVKDQGTAITESINASASSFDKLTLVIGQTVTAASNAKSIEELDTIINAIAASGRNGALGIDALRASLLALGLDGTASVVTRLADLGFTLSQIARITTAQSQGFSYDLGKQDPKQILKNAREFNKKILAEQKQQTSLVKPFQAENAELSKQNNTYDSQIKKLEKKKKLVDDNISAQQRITEELQKQNDFEASQADLAKKIVEAKIKGDFIEAANLRQLQANKLMEFQREDVLTPLQSESARIQKLIDALNDKREVNSTAISNNTDAVNALTTKVSKIKTLPPGEGKDSAGTFSDPIKTSAEVLDKAADQRHRQGGPFDRQRDPENRHFSLDDYDSTDKYQLQQFAKKRNFPKDTQFVIDQDGVSYQFRVEDDEYNVRKVKSFPTPTLPPVKRANGGYIAGPGTATSDSIPAYLSDGEYVIKASAVKQYGTGFLDNVNTQKFAKGGLVSESPGSNKKVSRLDKIKSFSEKAYDNFLFPAALSADRLLAAFGGMNPIASTNLKREKALHEKAINSGIKSILAEVLGTGLLDASLLAMGSGPVVTGTGRSLLGAYGASKGIPGLGTLLPKGSMPYLTASVSKTASNLAVAAMIGGARPLVENRAASTVSGLRPKTTTDLDPGVSTTEKTLSAMLMGMRFGKYESGKTYPDENLLAELQKFKIGQDVIAHVAKNPFVSKLASQKRMAEQMHGGTRTAAENRAAKDAAMAANPELNPLHNLGLHKYLLQMGSDGDITGIDSLYAVRQFEGKNKIDAFAQLSHDPIEGSELYAMGNATKGFPVSKSITQDLLALSVMRGAMQGGTTKTGINFGPSPDRSLYAEELVKKLEAYGLTKVFNVPKKEASSVGASKPEADAWMFNTIADLNSRASTLDKTVEIPKEAVNTAREALSNMITEGYNQKLFQDAVKKFGMEARIMGMAKGGLVSNGMKVPHELGMKAGSSKKINSFQKFMMGMAKDSGPLSSFLGLPSLYRSLAGQKKSGDTLSAAMLPLGGVSYVGKGAAKVASQVMRPSKASATILNNLKGKSLEFAKQDGRNIPEMVLGREGMLDAAAVLRSEPTTDLAKAYHHYYGKAYEILSKQNDEAVMGLSKEDFLSKVSSFGTTATTLAREAPNSVPDFLKTANRAYAEAHGLNPQNALSLFKATREVATENLGGYFSLSSKMASSYLNNLGAKGLDSSAGLYKIDILPEQFSGPISLGGMADEFTTMMHPNLVSAFGGAVRIGSGSTGKGPQRDNTLNEMYKVVPGVKLPEGMKLRDVKRFLTTDLVHRSITGSGEEYFQKMLAAGVVKAKNILPKFHDWNGPVPGTYGKELPAMLKSGTEGVYQEGYIDELKNLAFNNANSGSSVYNVSMTINGGNSNPTEIADQVMSKLKLEFNKNNKTNKVG